MELGMNFHLYGFLIGKDIHFDIEGKRIYRFSADCSVKNVFFGSLFINDTMMQLFLYLLMHGRGEEISREELLRKIWEEKSLCSSSQRLWQVVRDLNNRLVMIGLPKDFIISARGNGYMINYDDITPLYCERVT